MRSPSLYTPRRINRRHRNIPRAHVSRNAGDTNFTCGCMLFVFILLALSAAHGWAFQQQVRSFVEIFASA